MIIVVLCLMITTDWSSQFGFFLIYLHITAVQPSLVPSCLSLWTFITLLHFFIFIYLLSLLLSSCCIPQSIPHPSSPAVAALRVPFCWPAATASAHWPLL